MGFPTLGDLTEKKSANKKAEDDFKALIAAIENRDTALINTQIKDFTPDQKLSFCLYIITEGILQGYRGLAVVLYYNDTTTAASLLDGLTSAQKEIICRSISGEYSAFKMAIAGNFTNIAITLLDGLTPTIIAIYCNDVITEGPWKGYTAFGLAIKNKNAIIAAKLLDGLTSNNNDFKSLYQRVIFDHRHPLDGHTTLTLAFKNLELLQGNLALDIKVALCSTLLTNGVRTANDHTALTRAISDGNTTSTAILLNGLPDDALSQLIEMKTSIIFCDIPYHTSFKSWLALYNAYQDEPLAGYAARKGFDVKTIYLESCNAVMGDTVGFFYSLKNQIQPTFLTRQERKNFLLSDIKPLALAIGTIHHQISYVFDENDEIRANAADWLDDLTIREKRAALTLPGSAVGAENDLILRAFENGLNNLVAWLITQGIELPERFHPAADQLGIQYSQSIHNPAVHHTVGESLVALQKEQPLNEEEIKNALEELNNHTKTLPDSSNNKNVKAVAKRALERITKDEYLAYREARSQVSVAEMLAYFFINLQNLKTPGEKADALAILYNQLTIIQRDYNTDDVGADAVICVGGTLNQLTIGLGAVCPELVWVVFANDQTVAITGLNALPNIMTKAYKAAPNKKEFAEKCANKLEDKVLPDAIWPIVEEMLMQEMKDSLYNDNFVPPRCAIANLEGLERMVKDAIRILKAGTKYKKFSPEMHCPNRKLGILLNDLADSAGDIDLFLNTTLTRVPISVSTIKTRGGHWNLIKSEIKRKSELEKPQPMTNSVSYKELYIRSRSTTFTPFPIEIFNQVCKKCKQYAAKELSANTLPDSFQKMAGDFDLMRALLRLIEDHKTRALEEQKNRPHVEQKQSKVIEIYLDGIFQESKAGNIWLKSEDDFKITMGILKIPAKSDEKKIDEYLKENSQKIYEALFFLAPDILKQNQKDSTQRDYDTVINALEAKKPKK